MNEEQTTVSETIEIHRLISPAEYARFQGVTAPAITKKKKLRQINTINFKGGWLMVLDDEQLAAYSEWMSLMWT